MDNKVDIFNQGVRSYGLRNGARLEPKTSMSVDAEEAETLFKAYPQDIVSPDSYRTDGRDYRDNAAKMQRLREEVAILKAGAPVGVSLDTLKEVTDKAEAQIADLKAQLETAKAAGGTELEEIMNLTNKLQADAISSAAQIKELQNQLTQAQSDATALVTQTQEAGDKALADLKSQTAAALEVEEKAIEDQITAYNAALDMLPDGAKAPHFVLDIPKASS